MLEKNHKMSTDKKEPQKVSPDGEQPDIPFCYNYRKASFISKFFFTYAWPLIQKVRENETSMEESFIEDMTMVDGET